MGGVKKGGGDLGGVRTGRGEADGVEVGGNVGGALGGTVGGENHKGEQDWLPHCGVTLKDALNAGVWL